MMITTTTHDILIDCISSLALTPKERKELKPVICDFPWKYVYDPGYIHEANLNFHMYI